MANLPAVVNVDRHREEVLLLLVTNKRRLEPEHSLGKMQGPRVLELQVEPRWQRDRPAQAILQALRRKVQADHVERDVPAPIHSVGQQAIDQRGSVTGELRTGMLGDRLGIKGQAHDLRLAGGSSARQHQVIDLRLDLVPQAAGDLRVTPQKLLEWRVRTFDYMLINTASICLLLQRTTAH